MLDLFMHAHVKDNTQSSLTLYFANRPKLPNTSTPKQFVCLLFTMIRDFFYINHPAQTLWKHAVAIYILCIRC